ncbi:hypothetical protein GGS21DRAFT_502672 [Xylaria nigripes]|nr:hypothetical protein GGS21DRAFT_502672 [Xylaria nigripes]
MAEQDNIRDTDIKLRFKHGILTIFLFVNPVEPLRYVQEELLGILKGRYPDGITTSGIPPRITQLPKNASQIRFAVPKDKSDPAQGWKPLPMDADDTPKGQKLQDNMMVAFAIAEDDAKDADKVEFVVSFPSLEDADGEDGGNDNE